MKNNEKEFKYLGYTFKPVKKLSKDMDFFRISRYLKSDRELGFSTYDWWENKKDYSYEGFYKACNDSEYDIFKCIETGKNYIPASNELFQYTSK